MSGSDDRARNRLRKNAIHAFPEKAVRSGARGNACGVSEAVAAVLLVNPIAQSECLSRVGVPVLFFVFLCMPCEAAAIY